MLTESAAAKVEALKRAIGELPEPLQLQIEAEHFFAPGLYARQLVMPAPSCIVSKIHKTEHFCVALTGRVWVAIGDEELDEVVAPRLMRTLPGTERVLYVVEEATWITFHPTTETDLAKIEREVIATSHDDPAIEAFRRRQALEGPRS